MKQRVRIVFLAEKDGLSKLKVLMSRATERPAASPRKRG